MRTRLTVVSWIAILFLFGGCTSHKRQIVPFKMPGAYPNAAEVAGAVVAATAYADPEEAQKAFGWDIRGAGLFPVQVIFDNLGDHSLEIEPSQTFLIDRENNVWPILDSSLAYDRVMDKTEASRIGKGAAKPALWSGAAGALLGAAIGIVTSENVGESAGKGAALGAAVGATLGGAKAAAFEEDTRTTISEDLREKSLENSAVIPHSIAHGFIFFPGECIGAAELRLHLRVVESGDLHAVRFAL